MMVTQWTAYTLMWMEGRKGIVDKDYTGFYIIISLLMLLAGLFVYLSREEETKSSRHK